MRGTTRQLFTRSAIRAGAVLALVAGGLVATATPGFAADTVTLDKSHGPSGGGYTITMTSGTAATWSAGVGANLTVQFNLASTCPGTMPGATPIANTSNLVSAGIVETTVVKPAASTPLVVTVPSDMTLPAGTLAPATFSVCVYDTDTTPLHLSSANASFRLDANLTTDPTSGASGGGYAIALTSSHPVFDDFNSAGHQVQFQARIAGTTVCAATAQGASAPTASSATVQTGGVIAVPTASVTVPTTSKMMVNVPAALAQPTSYLMLDAKYLVCVYVANGSLILAETAPANAFSVTGNAALSTTSGSSAGGNTVSLTSASPIFSAGQAVLLDLVSPCPSTYATAGGDVVVSSMKILTPSKIAFTLPTPVLAPGSSPTPYAVCVYASSSPGAALAAAASGTYTVGDVPTITSVAPASGPAQGGSTITVSGSNFPTAGGAMTATVGGAAMTDIVVAVGGASFTATIPPHLAGGPFPIAVTTAGGENETRNLFTYSNGITVTPKTAPNSKMAATDLDITGVGFSDLVFGATYDTNSTKAHVYLVRGAYAPGATATSAAVKPNGQVTECIDVLVIGDTNLVCSLYLGGNLNPAPTPTTRTVSSCASSNSAGVVPTTVVASLYLAPSSSTATTCNFTSADVGMKITAGLSGAAIADNTTTIVAVSASGVATLSKISTTPVISTTTPITLSTSRTVADGVTSTDTTFKSAALSPLTTADVNKMITGPGIPTGTYITGVNNGTGVATLSKPTTVTTVVGGVAGFAIFTPTPVPNGTYTVTIVSNGFPGAQLNTTIPYTQSIVSSGSTFTVADYLVN